MSLSRTSGDQCSARHIIPERMFANGEVGPHSISVIVPRVDLIQLPVLLNRSQGLCHDASFPSLSRRRLTRLHLHSRCSGGIPGTFWRLEINNRAPNGSCLDFFKNLTSFCGSFPRILHSCLLLLTRLFLHFLNLFVYLWVALIQQLLRHQLLVIHKLNSLASQLSNIPCEHLVEQASKKCLHTLVLLPGLLHERFNVSPLLLVALKLLVPINFDHALSSLSE